MRRLRKPQVPAAVAGAFSDRQLGGCDGRPEALGVSRQAPRIGIRKPPVDDRKPKIGKQ
jgi:hypothetical protein